MEEDSKRETALKEKLVPKRKAVSAVWEHFSGNLSLFLSRTKTITIP